MPKLLKERFHPFCGIHMEGFVLRFPYIEIIFMMIGTGFLILGAGRKWDQWIKDKTENPFLYYLRLMLWLGYAIHIVSTLSLAALLRKATLSRNPPLIRVWIVCTLLSVLFALGVMYTNVAMFSQFIAHILSIVTGYGFLKFYLVYAVYFYMKDLEADILMSSALRPLTDPEINEFENGQEMPNFAFDLTTKNLVDKVQYERYKREDFEIPEDCLKTEMDSPLGKGEYGTVYRGTLRNFKAVENNEEAADRVTIVAIKTIDPDLADVMCFKALLGELKVMTCMGHHNNVVHFLGANTQNIRKRSLLLVLEFCALGSLHSFLRGSRGLFKNLVQDDGRLQEPHSVKNSNYDCPMSDSTSTLDLVRWAQEIAEGMDFLASQKVIHGDLATRNILLTDQKVSKITDFGLARQLYQYSVYVRKPNALVPWRWLSIEALADMNFSTYSDVWAYGITLWEMFTLGEVPYPGHNFSFHFLDQLKNGLRPTLSPNAPAFMSDLMQQCWKPGPKTRPSFSDISHFIHTHLTDPKLT